MRQKRAYSKSNLQRGIAKSILTVLKKLSVGVIGPSGIGKIYIRELIALGAKTIHIFGKRYLNSLKLKKEIEKEFKIKIIVLKNIKQLRLLKLDLVCICSPSNTHLKYIDLFAKKKTKILTEKPLFWLKDNTIQKNIKIIDQLFEKFSQKLLTNLPMIYYTKSLKNQFSIDIKKINKITFKYYTSGKNKYKNIGADILPHALSFLYSLFPIKDEKFKIQYIKENKNSWKTRFYLKKILCFFDFDQSLNRKKSLLIIKINTKTYSRKQNIQSRLYANKIFICNNRIKKKINNPMTEAIKANILKLINDKINKKDVFTNKTIIKIATYFLNEK
jgi:hypothetical protein